MEKFDLFDSKKKFKIQKPVRLIELFGGIGAQAKALENLGVEFEHYKYVEIDKFACESYNAVHNTNFKTSDITKVHADDLEIVDVDKYDYLMTYSFPCFTGDTLVLTDKGYKEVSKVEISDKVLTHTNTYNSVIASRKTGEKEVYRIKAMCFDELKATENHKFYAREKYRTSNKRCFKKPEWVELKNLTKNYYLGYAINQNSIIPKWEGTDFTWIDGRKSRQSNKLNSLMNNQDFWYIIGRYIGDGWIRTQGGIVICYEKHKPKLIEEALDRLGIGYNVVEDKTTYKVHIPTKEFGQFVEQFGKGAVNKHLTNIIFDLPSNLLKAFIDGYLDADGYYNQKTNTYKISTVSRELAYGIVQIVAKAFHVHSRMYKSIKDSNTIIENREVNQHDLYEVVFKLDYRKQDKAFYENGYMWFPIQSIEKLSTEDVYDIEVENDHSFTANGAVVHNCQDLSTAGKQRGMTKGSNTRSGLLWEVERILEECDNNLPQILLMENVPNVIGKKNIKDFELWQLKLESLGYSNYYTLLNAKNFGIPQNRERCFMVSLLGNYTYSFPEKIPLDKKLLDFLDEQVDENYYLKNYQLEAIKKSSFNAKQNIIQAGDICATLLARDRFDPKCAKVANLTGGKWTNEFQHRKAVYSPEKISPTLLASDSGDHACKIIETTTNEEIKVIGELHGDRWKNVYKQAKRVFDPDGCSPTLDTCSTGTKVAIPAATSQGYMLAGEGDGVILNRPHIRRGTVQEQSISTLTTFSDNVGVVEQIIPDVRIRKLTPKEYWRLMGFDDDDFNKAVNAGISKSQLYKQAGNSIVVNVLMAIFKNLY